MDNAPNHLVGCVIQKRFWWFLFKYPQFKKKYFRTCVLERRHIIGGASVTEEIVPGFKFSRASYVLSLLRPQIFKDLELKKHGLKVRKK